MLACVDWGDAAEAREAAALTAAWTPVDTATALELLSPAFSNPEARLTGPSHLLPLLSSQTSERVA